MKLIKLSVLAAATLCTLNLMAQETDCTVIAQSKNTGSTDMLYVAYKNRPGSMKFDSVAFVKGKCELAIHVPFVQRAMAYVVKANSGFLRKPITEKGISFYTEQGKVLLEIGENPLDTKRSGTALNNDFQAYSDVIAPFKKKESLMEEEFTAAKNSNDQAKMTQLQQDYQTLNEEKGKAERNFFDTHLDSQISLDWMEQTIDIANRKSEAQAMYRQLSQRVRESDAGKRYGMKIESTQTVEIGNVAPDFTARTPGGEEISLSSYRGKYVFVDFWASWCAPCRHENPNVVKAYATYKSDKFDILGVSLDQDKAAWENAISKDGLTWKQVSDLMGWQSMLAMSYAIRAIPANFLIDPQGKIIARDLRGDALEKKLSEVLK